MLSIEEQDQDSLPFVGSIGVQESMFYSTSESGRYSESMFYSLDHADNSNLHYNSQESSDCSGHNVFIANPGGDDTNCYFDYSDNLLAYNSYTSKGFCMMSDEDSCFFAPSLTDTVMEEGVMGFSEDGRSDGSENNSDHGQMEPIVPSHHKQLQLKRKPEEDEINISSSLCGNQKKRPRASRDVQRCMKNARSKRNQKPDRSENEAQETTNAGSDHGHGSSSYTSDQENSNTSASLNSNGKRRASRGSATDPQSLYARKRRERINERLRILQSLVPNGTKVDISTMLEEALHYVKFLQLQIKLLSSDDFWMYAPIAYNGVDIGLDLSNNISPPL